MKVEVEPRFAYDSLAIETTRRCNMACAHCLRGDAQAMDMKPEYIDRILDTAEYIGTILFSGGEPALNPGIIRHTLDYVKGNDIPVYGFSLVTNGSLIPPGFLELMRDWYEYCLSCGARDVDCRLYMSRDEFHDPVPRENLRQLGTLPFFEPASDGGYTWNRWKLMDEGRGEYLQGYKKEKVPNGALHVQEYDTDAYEVGSVLYLSCTGDIVHGCNYSYEHMPEHRIGSVSDMDAYIQYLKTKAAVDAA